MTPVQRAAVWISGSLGALALVGLWLARDLPFAGPRGAFVGTAAYEVIGTSYSPLGAGVAIALAGLGVAGALTRRPTLLWLAAGGHALLAVQVVAQFGQSTNWLGSRGSNLSTALIGAVGLATLAWAMAVESDVAADGSTTDPEPSRSR
ncbi:MAG: hypothetical protein JJU45_02530 [Acidimicrobiia bacterium]|nr:hypothetical protein [Acidimicrobiia bacterium]